MLRQIGLLTLAIGLPQPSYQRGAAAGCLRRARRNASQHHHVLDESRVSSEAYDLGSGAQRSNMHPQELTEATGVLCQIRIRA